MKRLLGLLGLTCLVVLTACFYMGSTAAKVLGGSAVVLFIASVLIPVIRRKKTLPVLLLTTVFAASLFLGYTSLYVDPIKEEYDGVTAEIVATQKSEATYSYGYYSYELDVSMVNGEAADFKMMLKSKQYLYTEPYDQIALTCKLEAVDSGYASKRIFIRSYVFDEIKCQVTSPENKPFMYHIIRLRSELNTTLYKELDYDTASFSSAVLLGNKTALEPEFKELLRNTGLSHIAVVSGLHLSIVAMLSRKVYMSLFHNKTVSGILTILSILFFAALTGFGSSVVRASVMLIIFTVGSMTGRKSDSVNSIGAAALVLTLTNPYSVGDVGMLLSFAATLGIVLWSGKLTAPVMNRLSKFSLLRGKFVRRFVRLIVESVSCSLCATLWTLPISIIVFEGFSLVTIAANLLVVPLMTAVVSCIALCVVFHYVGFLSLLGDAIGRLVSLFYEYLLLICNTLSSLPFAYIHTTKPYFLFWVIVSVVIAIVASLIRKKFVTVIAVLMSLFVLFSSSAIYDYTHRNTLTLYIPDTGSGVSMILESNAGHAVLSACGSKSRSYVVNDCVDAIGFGGNDVLVITQDYNSELYAKNLLNEFDYEIILRYDSKGNETEESSEEDEKEIVFSDIHVLNLWDKAQITLIPCGDRVFEYITIGSTDILYAPTYGDCKLLPKEYTTADILVVEGNVFNSDCLKFDTLILPGEVDGEDLSVVKLCSVAESVRSGTDISLEIDVN